jgi:hypothetical protein
MYRQGDVLIVPISAIPGDLEKIPRENGRLILAHGEATGHAHAITSSKATLFRDPKLNAMFLQVVEEPVALVHDEHNSIALVPGNYQIIRQREYSPQEIRNVAD